MSQAAVAPTAAAAPPRAPPQLPLAHALTACPPPSPLAAAQTHQTTQCSRTACMQASVCWVGGGGECECSRGAAQAAEQQQQQQAAGSSSSKSKGDARARLLAPLQGAPLGQAQLLAPKHRVPSLRQQHCERACVWWRGGWTGGRGGGRRSAPPAGRLAWLGAPRRRTGVGGEYLLHVLVQHLRGVRGGVSGGWAGRGESARRHAAAACSTPAHPPTHTPNHPRARALVSSGAPSSERGTSGGGTYSRRYASREAGAGATRAASAPRKSSMRTQPNTWWAGRGGRGDGGAASWVCARRAWRERERTDAIKLWRAPRPGASSETCRLAPLSPPCPACPPPPPPALTCAPPTTTLYSSTRTILLSCRFRLLPAVA